MVACLEEGADDEHRGDEHGKAARREHDDPIPTGRLDALELQDVRKGAEPRAADLYRQHPTPVQCDSGRPCKRHTYIHFNQLTYQLAGQPDSDEHKDDENYPAGPGDDHTD